MELTKYEHACLTLEKDGQLLVIDPGSMSTDFISPGGVVAIVVTHDHADHFDHEQLAAIINENPNALILAPETVTSQIEAFTTQTVAAGDTADIGPFHLAFFGGKHAVIHSATPVTDNVGVMVNELLYYPGDSLALPGQPVDTLAVPIAAPWLKIGEAIDFMSQIRPRLAFPTHDAIFSPFGNQVADRWLSGEAAKQDITYQRLTNTITI